MKCLSYNAFTSRQAACAFRLLACFLPARLPVTLRGQQPYKHDCCYCSVPVALCFIRAESRTCRKFEQRRAKIHLRNYFTLTFALRFLRNVSSCARRVLTAGRMRQNEIAPVSDSSVLLLLNYYTESLIALLEIFFRFPALGTKLVSRRSRPRRPFLIR